MKYGSIISIIPQMKAWKQVDASRLMHKERNIANIDPSRARIFTQAYIIHSADVNFPAQEEIKLPNLTVCPLK